MVSRLFLFLCLVGFSVSAAAQVKPKIYIIFDTSGSMLENTAGNTTVKDHLCSNTQNQVHGEGKQDIDHVAMDKSRKRTAIPWTREEVKQPNGHCDGNNYCLTADEELPHP